MNDLGKPQRITSVEWIRIFAAVCVIMFHFEALYFGKNVYFGNMAIVVDFFFMLSGFLMMKSILKKRENGVEPGSVDALTESLRYAFHKIKSFYAPYLLAFIMVFVLTTITMQITDIQAILARLFHFKWELILLQLAGFTPDPGFDGDYLVGSAWYLSAMVISMVPVYFLARYQTRVFTNIIAPMAAMVIYCYIMQKYGTMDVGNEMAGCIMLGVLRGFAGLSMGCICCALWARAKEKTWPKRLTNIAAVGEGLCFISLPLLILCDGFFEKYDILFWVFIFGLLIFLGFSDRTPISRGLNHHLTGFSSFLGRLSLYLYLFHWFFVLLFATYFQGFSYWQGQLLFVAAVFAFSIIMMLCFERKKSKSK